ncbi:MAG: YggS family pyridoxal phosphate-dependent enzyme [Bacilli bacterium]|nr:YggS family pyridoxal phosphate-dependent enzyme [Bacilli bacterium]
MDKQKILDVIVSTKGRQIIVASKYINAEQILALRDLGLTEFGENRADALLGKYDALKGEEGIHFHFIGHLQSNKAKDVANRIVCLHSLDSLKTARILNAARTAPLDCYVELHLTPNEAKSGVKEEDLGAFLDGLKQFPNIRVIGFMAMSDADMDEGSKRAVFHRAALLAKQYGLSKLSMGMSEDYLLAIEEGATTLRLGRTLTSHC